ncbi:hypothetical protein SKP52_02445 [Sphingopyxis fribergensis]|uniref:Uncharacterized protein n=1 Tax=Sphingopyxis fribergensis TaxID=1515612 RepID=A0A0A7PBU9_9SPHN|nr:hypothetical protein [Sphingopyxis fribergensis]AJA07424.1 hypothetical protein SKP52_02445 [Sphingopyxis fribergensis]
MARHDPELTKAYEANRAAITAANRFRAEEVRMQIIRHGLLADRPNHPDAAFNRQQADNYRAELARLQATGL